MRKVILGVMVAMASTAHGAGEPKLYVRGEVKGVSKGDALNYVASNGLDTMIYECKQQVKGRKGLENLPGDSVFVIGQVSGSPEKWSAITAVAKGQTTSACVRKVINTHTGNFKNF